MKNIPILLILISLLLTACGGGGGESIDKGETSSSSSSVVSTCVNTDGAVFINEVCGSWEDPSFYEQNKTTFAGGENTTGVGNNLNLTVIPETGNVSNSVIDIHYGMNNNFNAAPRILNNPSLLNGVNLTEYANGSLQFDLKVINPGVDNPTLQMTIECGWPCVSTFEIIQPGALNEWKRIEIPVAHLIDRGLNIQRVSTGFQIMPEWNKQSGVHLQIDNMRWVKNNVKAPTANICYANYMNVQPSSGSIIDVSSISNSTTNISDLRISSIYPTLIFSPRWDVSGIYNIAVGDLIDGTTFDPVSPSAMPSCVDNGLLVFDMYIDKGYTPDFPVVIFVGLGGKNLPTIFLEEGIISNSDLILGNWKRISIPVSVVNSAGLNRVVFNISGPSTAESLGAIMIDNIQIIKPAP
jgi:hypothetical protein